LELADGNMRSLVRLRVLAAAAVEPAPKIGPAVPAAKKLLWRLR
jgi:hypothetical protein